MEEQIHGHLDRRRVLQTMGAAGMAGIGLSGNVEAAATEIEVEFIEFGVYFDHSKDVPIIDQYDPMSFYSIEGSELVFSAVEKSTLEALRKNEAVVHHDRYDPLPTVLSRKEYSSTYTGLNNRLEPTNATILKNPVPTPAVRIRMEGGEVQVRVANNEVRVSEKESGEMKLSPATSATINEEPVTITPIIRVANHGKLTVTAQHVIGGE